MNHQAATRSRTAETIGSMYLRYASVFRKKKRIGKITATMAMLLIKGSTKTIHFCKTLVVLTKC